FIGRIDSLSAEQRIAFAASVAINFPERTLSHRSIYVDVSGLIEPTILAQSNRRLKEVLQLIEGLRDEANGVPVFVATGPHDHEFYAVDIENIERTLYVGDRAQRIIRPSAGDAYVGLHVYSKRNSAQWELLMTWRQMGVLTVFRAPERLESIALGDDADEDALALAHYLSRIAHFDAMVAPRQDCMRLREWIDDYGPPRLRKIILGDDLLSLLMSPLHGNAMRGPKDRKDSLSRPDNSPDTKRAATESSKIGQGQGKIELRMSRNVQ
ncbi:MAG TPA: hypothetical protein VM912_07340, partial [Terriglobales bacterium]|nr:hypothetical protein [Terriglobales bacterium]